MTLLRLIWESAINAVLGKSKSKSKSTRNSKMPLEAFCKIHSKQNPKPFANRTSNRLLWYPLMQHWSHNWQISQFRPSCTALEQLWNSEYSMDLISVTFRLFMCFLGIQDKSSNSDNATLKPISQSIPSLTLIHPIIYYDIYIFLLHQLHGCLQMNSESLRDLGASMHPSHF
jgi:hypothetical protein